MIITLENTTASEVAKRIIQVREEGGALALSRVLTLLVIHEGLVDETSIAAANAASSEHPMRVIVVETDPDAPTRLDAEIRVGRDAGAGEVIVLHAQGATSTDPETLVQGLLLPEAPVVAWWPRWEGASPSAAPLGRIAQLRIVDRPEDDTNHDPADHLARLASGWQPGDTNLDWTRLTGWRAQLAAVLDMPPYEPVLEATVRGRCDSALPILLAGWLQHYLDAPVELEWQDGADAALCSVRLRRDSGEVVLERIDVDTIRFAQDGHPEQVIPLPVRSINKVLAEELRSLASDEVYATVLLEGVPRLRRTDSAHQ